MTIPLPQLPDRPTFNDDGRLNRRDAIRWMLAAAGALAVMDPTARGDAGKAPPIIGSDPNLVNPVVPWELTLTEAQRKTLTPLCDLIIPADDKSPAASKVGVVDFIDEWVSAPYDWQRSDRGVILKGIDWLEAESKRRFEKPFAVLDDKQMTAIADDLANPGAAKPEHREAAQFFDRVRWLTVGAFYTTPEGWRDIGYIGNVPLKSFDGPPPEVLKHFGLE